jgi:hypothetical protein
MAKTVYSGCLLLRNLLALQDSCDFVEK